MSCASSKFCGLISFRGRATFFNGSTWSPSTQVDNFGMPNDISCPSSTFCAMVDDVGRAFW